MNSNDIVVNKLTGFFFFLFQLATEVFLCNVATSCKYNPPPKNLACPNIIFYYLLGISIH